MNKRKISYLAISDLHLGHTHTTTEFIVHNLRRYFVKHHNVLKNLDIIFVVGDIFDKLLATHSKEYKATNDWILELAFYCKNNNIKLRTLEGTASHDWGQVEVISDAINKLDHDIDYKYIKTLDIELIDDLGISVLYVPDDYNDDAKDTVKEVDQLLRLRNIPQVDIAMVHGQFHFQLPMVRLDVSHTEEDYLKRVKYYTSVGHIHTSKIFKRILGQGSFDRLAHNEEEKKGAMVINIYASGDMDYKFLVNENAKVYKKYTLPKASIESVLEFIEKKLNKHTHQDYVRFITQEKTGLHRLDKVIKSRFPFFKIDLKPAQASEKQKLLSTLEQTPVIDTFSITPENIRDLMEKELLSMDLTKEQLSIFQDELTALQD